MHFLGKERNKSECSAWLPLETPKLVFLIFTLYTQLKKLSPDLHGFQMEVKQDWKSFQNI